MKKTPHNKSHNILLENIITKNKTKQNSGNDDYVPKFFFNFVLIKFSKKIDLEKGL